VNHIFKKTGSTYTYSSIDNNEMKTISSVKCTYCDFIYWVYENGQVIEGHDFISCEEQIIKNIIE